MEAYSGCAVLYALFARGFEACSQWHPTDSYCKHKVISRPAEQIMSGRALSNWPTRTVSPWILFRYTLTKGCQPALIHCLVFGIFALKATHQLLLVFVLPLSNGSGVVCCLFVSQLPALLRLQQGPSQGGAAHPQRSSCLPKDNE